MLLKKTLLLIATVCLLSACATEEERRVKSYQISQTTPVCNSTADCKLKWELAQLWVAKNIKQKIRMHSDVLIETQDDSSKTTDLAVRVMKKPIGAGQYKIVFEGWCHNEFSCFPDDLDSAMKFNMDVNLATY